MPSVNIFCTFCCVDVLASLLGDSHIVHLYIHSMMCIHTFIRNISILKIVTLLVCTHIKVGVM